MNAQPPIRAKFCCMSTTKNWDGTSRAELKPVGRQAGGNFPENAAFWQYTPTGEAALNFPVGVECPFKEGHFYYIDMAPTETRRGWTLSRTSSRGAGSGEIVFDQGYGAGVPTGLAAKASYSSLRMDLSGGSAKVAQFGEPGQPWDVAFTFADDGTIAN